MSIDRKQSPWNISNGLSAVRIVLIVPIAFLVMSGTSTNRVYAFGLLVVGAATDILDGYFARKFSQVTDFGRILDPLADKIALIVLALLLATQNLLPPWFVLAAIIRDVLIFSGGIYIQRSKHIVLQSNWLGKLTAIILASLVAISILNIESLSIVKTILMFASTIMLLLSFISYAKRFVEVK